MKPDANSLVMRAALDRMVTALQPPLAAVQREVIMERGD